MDWYEKAKSLADECERVKVENRALIESAAHRETDFPAQRMLDAIRPASHYDPATRTLYVSERDLLATIDGKKAFNMLTANKPPRPRRCRAVTTEYISLEKGHRVAHCWLEEGHDGLHMDGEFMFSDKAVLNPPGFPVLYKPNVKAEAEK